MAMHTEPKHADWQQEGTSTNSDHVAISQHEAHRIVNKRTREQALGMCR